MSEQQATEIDAPCDPPCSLACMVSEGRHHTAESLRAAALAELMDGLPPRVTPPGVSPNDDKPRMSPSDDTRVIPPGSDQPR